MELDQDQKTVIVGIGIIAAFIALFVIALIYFMPVPPPPPVSSVVVIR